MDIQSSPTPWSEYHHSQRTRYTLEEAQEQIGKRARLVLEGTIVEARETDAGTCVIFEMDERFGFDTKIGMDLELLEVIDR